MNEIIPGYHDEIRRVRREIYDGKVLPRGATPETKWVTPIGSLPFDDRQFRNPYERAVAIRLGRIRTQ